MNKEPLYIQRSISTPTSMGYDKTTYEDIGVTLFAEVQPYSAEAAKLAYGLDADVRYKTYLKDATLEDGVICRYGNEYMQVVMIRTWPSHTELLLGEIKEADNGTV